MKEPAVSTEDPTQQTITRTRPYRQHMGYYISVWDGAVPSNTREAHRIYEQIHREAHPRVAPTPPILDFLAVLRREWPGVPGDRLEGTPWKWDRLEDEAAGRLWDTSLTFESAATAVPRIAALAEERGLVLFDPQYRRMRVAFRPGWEQ